MDMNGIAQEWYWNNVVTGHYQSNFSVLRSCGETGWLSEITPAIFYKKTKLDSADNSEADGKVWTCF